jgi:hypothetical protein
MALVHPQSPGKASLEPQHRGPGFGSISRGEHTRRTNHESVHAVSAACVKHTRPGGRGTREFGSGAADIPATRLLGQTPGGLQSTGQSDIRNYYDRISAGQNLEVRPALSRLDEILIRSALGSRPDAVQYTWAPLWQMTEVEKADVFAKKAKGTKDIADTGLIPDQAFARGVQNMFVEDVRGFVHAISNQAIDCVQLGEAIRDP